MAARGCDCQCAVPGDGAAVCFVGLAPKALSASSGAFGYESAGASIDLDGLFEDENELVNVGTDLHWKFEEREWLGRWVVACAVRSHNRGGLRAVTLNLSP